MKKSNEDRLIQELLADYKSPEDLIGGGGLLKRLTKKLVEGALSAEMTHHLGYEKHAAEGQGSGNSHLTRASLSYVNWKERKAVATDLKAIYRADTVEQAELELQAFSAKWNLRYPTIAPLWSRNWERVTPFFAFPSEIRRIIYTTNAVESLNMSLRKIIKTRGAFPSQEATPKLLFLALRNVTVRWEVVQHWKAALSRFTLLWEDRIVYGARWLAWTLRPRPFSVVRTGCNVPSEEVEHGQQGYRTNLMQNLRVVQIHAKPLI